MIGWNLPPGCDIPGNSPEICDCCGRDAGECICPECYMPQCCGAQGDPACYVAGHLEYSPEQIAGREAYLAAREEDERWSAYDS